MACLQMFANVEIIAITPLIVGFDDTSLRGKRMMYLHNRRGQNLGLNRRGKEVGMKLRTGKTRLSVDKFYRQCQPRGLCGTEIMLVDGVIYSSMAYIGLDEEVGQDAL